MMVYRWISFAILGILMSSQAIPCSKLFSTELIDKRGRTLLGVANEVAAKLGGQVKYRVSEDPEVEREFVLVSPKERSIPGLNKTQLGKLKKFVLVELGTKRELGYIQYEIGKSRSRVLSLTDLIIYVDQPLRGQNLAALMFARVIQRTFQDFNIKSIALEGDFCVEGSLDRRGSHQVGDLIRGENIFRVLSKFGFTKIGNRSRVSAFDALPGSLTPPDVHFSLGWEMEAPEMRHGME